MSSLTVGQFWPTIASAPLLGVAATGRHFEFDLIVFRLGMRAKDGPLQYGIFVLGCEMERFAFVGLCCSVLLVAGCSSGGGGSSTGPVTSSSANNSSPTSSGTSNSTPPAAVTIGAAGSISMGANAPILATGTTPNFMNSPPPPTMAIPVNQTVLSVTQTSVADANAGGGTLTFQPGPSSTQINGTFFPTVELKIPSLALDLPNLSGLPQTIGPGNNPTTFANLNYLTMGIWSNTSAANPNGYGGALIAGFQTPTSVVPTQGKAFYQSQFSGSTGVVSGIVYAPSGNGTIDTARVTGAAQISVDFVFHTVSGGLTGMLAPGGSWNDVALTGTISGSSLSGTTEATGLNRDPKFGMQTSYMGTAATGTFSGALYGPNGEEMGLVWTLHDNAGKTAIGTVAAVKVP